MERPLDIAFHGLDSSPALETEIREHVERLEARCGSVVGCRVSIEALNHRHREGVPYGVHIVGSTRGRDVAVTHEPHHGKERHAHPDIHTALRDAFHTAERQLQQLKDH